MNAVVSIDSAVVNTRLEGLHHFQRQEWPSALVRFDQWLCEYPDDRDVLSHKARPLEGLGPAFRELSVYGEPGQEVKLMDGVMMAIRSETLIARDLRFEPQFLFEFYDLDFCRQAEIKRIRMGTWAISVVHASAGALGVNSWRAAYARYLAQYGEM